MPVPIRWPVPEDLEIAQEAELRPIQDVARDAGLLEDELEQYGRHVAKIDYVRALERLRDRPDGKLIAVTAITPTPLGEGKSHFESLDFSRISSSKPTANGDKGTR